MIIQISSGQRPAECDLSGLEGTVLWICKSPYRPEHKRKNWFVDVSVIPEAEPVVSDSEIRFERFHCGGKARERKNSPNRHGGNTRRSSAEIRSGLMWGWSFGEIFLEKPGFSQKQNCHQNKPGALGMSFPGLF